MSAYRSAAPTLPLRILPTMLFPLVASLLATLMAARDINMPVSTTLPERDLTGATTPFEAVDCLCTTPPATEAREAAVLLFKAVTGDAFRPNEDLLLRIRGRSIMFVLSLISTFCGSTGSVSSAT